MDQRISDLLSHCRMRTGASAQMLVELIDKVGANLPESYLSVMRHTNGLEGHIGVTSYLILHTVQEIPELQRTGDIEEYFPGFVVFGSNGGDTGYAFDTNCDRMLIVSFSLSSYSDPVHTLGSTFTDFLEHLSMEDRVGG